MTVTPFAPAAPRRPRLLWNGDACVATGFARVTHKVLETLAKTWEPHVLGINYHGDPHDYPYRVYPAGKDGDLWGLNRIEKLARQLEPEIIVVQNDPWNVSHFVRALAGKTAAPLVAYMPVDGDNCQGRNLVGLSRAIFYTSHGRREAHLGGYTGPSDAINLGVDTVTYQPVEREQARRSLGLSPRVLPGAFIVGNVNRNQPRKRLDLTLAYFAEWITGRQIRDAYLYLHLAPTGDLGWDVMQLARYYGIEDRVLVRRDLELGVGLPEPRLAEVYSAFDAQLSTTQGEGFGLCTLEGMACGIPQVVPDWSALGEWVTAGAIKVPCTNIAVTPRNVNAIGGVADRAAVVEALDTLYRDPARRAELGAEALALAREERFQWADVGRRFALALSETLADHRAANPTPPALAPLGSAYREQAG